MKKAIIIGISILVTGVILSVALVEQVSPKNMTRSAIGETFARINLFARQNKSIPSSLAVLPKREGYVNRTTDAWNRPLQYDVTADGFITIKSLGRDGKPGEQGEYSDISVTYYSKKPDGSLWAGSDMWLVEAEIKEKVPLSTSAGTDADRNESCATSPVDISGATSEKELDQYLGKQVTFTGKWQNSKESGMSNGHVFITPDLAFWGGWHGYKIGSSETVTGYLTKDVVDYSGLPPDRQDVVPAQEPLAGNNYCIVKDQPTKDSIVHRYPRRP